MIPIMKIVLEGRDIQRKVYKKQMESKEIKGEIILKW
jgi:hypothetical protein